MVFLLLAALSAAQSDLATELVNGGEAGERSFRVSPADYVVGGVLAVGALGYHEAIEILPVRRKHQESFGGLVCDDAGCPPYQDLFWQVQFAPTQAAATHSDLVMNGSMAAAALIPLRLDVKSSGGARRIALRKLVIAESVFATIWLTDLTKSTTARARPYAKYQPHPVWQHEDSPYDAEELYVNPTAPACETTDPGCTFIEPDAFYSFPSGHTSVVAASLTSWWMTEVVLSSPQDHWARTGGTVLFAGAGTASVAWMRIRAGKHHPSDVVTGALLGGGMGVLVPMIHKKPGDSSFGLRVHLRDGVALSGRW